MLRRGLSTTEALRAHDIRPEFAWAHRLQRFHAHPSLVELVMARAAASRRFVSLAAVVAVSCNVTPPDTSGPVTVGLLPGQGGHDPFARWT